MEVSSKEWDIGMQNTGKMSGGRLKVISIIKEKSICTRERQNKGCGYSEEEGKTCGGEDEKDFVLKVTWKLEVVVEGERHTKHRGGQTERAGL